MCRNRVNEGGVDLSKGWPYLLVMPLTIEIPDDIAAELGGTAVERTRQARELIALELYREGLISLRTMGKFAGLGSDYWKADAFRAEHGLPLSGPGIESLDELDSLVGE